MSSIVRLSPVGPVTFKRRALEPATDAYVTGDDVILFGVRSSQAPTVTFRARVQKPDGTIVIFEQTQVIASETDTTIRFRMLTGFLLGAAISTSSTTLLSGECYVWAHMISAGGADVTVARALIGGYLVAGLALGWPDTPILAPGTGPGFFGSVPITNVSAGVEFSFDNTTDRRLRFIALVATLVTDATVISRRVLWRLLDGSDILFFAASPNVQNAGENRQYSISAGGGEATLIGAHFLLALPVNTYLPAGMFLSTNTISQQAGDQWSDGFVYAEMWVLPTIT